jgi:hypothetical protein
LWHLKVNGVVLSFRDLVGSFLCQETFTSSLLGKLNPKLTDAAMKVPTLITVAVVVFGLLLSCNVNFIAAQTNVPSSSAESFSGSWDIQVIDPGEAFGGQLVLESKSNPNVLYTGYDFHADNLTGLYYAAWNGKNWTKQNVDPIGINGVLLLDSHDSPFIVYVSRLLYDTLFQGIITWHHANYTLKEAVWNGSNWTTQTLGLPWDENCSLGQESVIMDHNGTLYVAYTYSYTSSGALYSDLYIAKGSGSNWTAQMVYGVLTFTGNKLSISSMTFDPKGNPAIVFTESVKYSSGQSSSFHNTLNVMYASWTGSSWYAQVAAANASAPGRNVVYNSEGKPCFAYVGENITANFNDYLVNEQLNFAVYDGVDWRIQVVNSEPKNLAYGQPYLKLDSNDNPQVCYYQADFQYDIGGSLMNATWTGSQWKTQNLTTSAINSYIWTGYGVDPANIAAMAFDAKGNLSLTLVTVIGTYRSAIRWGNLSYAKLVQPIAATPVSSSSSAQTSHSPSPTPPVPEFPSWIILPALLIFIGLLEVAIKRKSVASFDNRKGFGPKAV